MFWMTCVLCTQTHFAHGRLYREILFIYALKPYTDIKKVSQTATRIHEIFSETANRTK